LISWVQPYSTEILTDAGFTATWQTGFLFQNAICNCDSKTLSAGRSVEAAVVPAPP
jgi:hypothetical protein